MTGIWEGRQIERVKEFKYLGCTFNERVTDKAHMKEIWGWKEQEEVEKMQEKHLRREWTKKRQVR
jgi:hypothetical protein